VARAPSEERTDKLGQVHRTRWMRRPCWAGVSMASSWRKRAGSGRAEAPRGHHWAICRTRRSDFSDDSTSRVTSMPHSPHRYPGSGKVISIRQPPGVSPRPGALSAASQSIVARAGGLRHSRQRSPCSKSPRVNPGRCFSTYKNARRLDRPRHAVQPTASHQPGRSAIFRSSRKVGRAGMGESIAHREQGMNIGGGNVPGYIRAAR